VRRVCALFFVLFAVLAASAAVTAAPAAKPLTLRERVLRTGELRGFKPSGAPTTYTRPRFWVSNGTGLTRVEVAARTARLKREGFKAVVTQLLVPTRGSNDRGGFSWAMQLKSAAAARNERSAVLKYSATEGKGIGHRFRAFRVTGIPGAGGFRLTKPGVVSDNVVFADGAFVYLVGARWEAYARRPPARTTLIAAARALYKRVHGRAA